MAGSEAVDAPPSSRRWAAFAGIENSLVRTVAGVPATVRTKLLLSFLVIAALLVLVCVLGLRVLGQANARVERLGQLQLRSTRYQVLEQSANDMEQALGARSAGAPGFAAYTGGKKIGGGRQWQRVDLSLSDLLVAGRAQPRRAHVRLRPAAGRGARAQPHPARLSTARPRRGPDQPARHRQRQGQPGPAVPQGCRQRGRQPPDLREKPRRDDEQRDLGAHRAESQRLHLVAQPLRRGGRDQRRSRSRARSRAVVVARRSHPAHRSPAGRDCGGGLQRPRGRSEP